jgi:magnesium transporter
VRELRLSDWWRVAVLELPTGITLGAILGFIGILRITLWQELGFFRLWTALGTHRHHGCFCVDRDRDLRVVSRFNAVIPAALGFDPASASAPFVATLVDVTGLVIYSGLRLLS